MEQSNHTPATPGQQNQQVTEETQYLIRIGGPIEVFYVSDSVFSCFPQEGKRFALAEANALVKRLTQEGKYNTWTTDAMRVMAYSRYM